MGIAGVAILMLMVAFITYLRMISKRRKVRERRQGQAERLILEQAETLSGFGRDADAIKLLEEALLERPDSNAIRAQLEILRARSEP